MDPGDKIYTIDEFRCWKVENLDDERSDENNNEGGANVTQYLFRHDICSAATYFQKICFSVGTF